ncbi:hypothetical protein OSJ77_07080 [Phyllobacterium sp. 0TCS1.6C]|uniref:hypothetical protein n=1 Tax=unclassified Phyllobacterium TaxID=2638441 RepID=UPI0022655B4C|nr:MULTISPECIES: hypothetical protein [unclassified Phyllobacterium]MCX8279945.1 hypothetical protein [Phyllobacterium sp. 0TCS1.6C]MCX8296112.1 hypothetical protein [Phyllobacterium sp. 0TCS1.6A]
MAKYFLLGDASDLWLVDVEAGSVVPISEELLASPFSSDMLKLVDRARRNGMSLIRGVSVAISGDARAELATKSYSENNEN